MHIYFISGLGADERVFRRLDLPAEWEKVYLKWIDIEAEDTLESYAAKYIPFIDTSNKFILAGLSFGGMIVSELSQVISPEITFIISSISNKKEMPFLLRFLKYVPLYRIAPLGSKNKLLAKLKLRFASWHLGAYTPEEKELISDYIDKASPHFLRSAIRIISNWKNEVRTERIIQINGDRDNIFPLNNLQSDYVIKGGGHFMVFNRAKEISDIMKEEMGKIGT